MDIDPKESLTLLLRRWSEGDEDGRAPDLVALDEALHSLGEIDPKKVRLVELRF